MKIRFIEDTNIRKVPKTKGNQPVGYIYLGAEIEVEPDAVKGEALEGNNQWYRDKNGWYYWSGRTEVLAPPAPKPPETTGGFVMAPATPSAIAALEEDTSVPTVKPPLANDDDRWRTGEIPEGETRVVPPLDVLLDMEKQARTTFFQGIPSPRSVPPSPVASVSVQEPTRRSTAPPSGGPVPPAATEPDMGLESTRRQAPAPPPDIPPLDLTSPKPTGRWQTPAPNQLNWCVRDYRIAQDWWIARNLTGDKVTLALLGTGIATNHPDLTNVQGTYSYLNTATPMTDLHGLGTQAAIVAAGTGACVFGVAPEARLLIGKIGEQDHLITPDGLIAGLGWAIEAGADIVALLVDFPEVSSAQQATLQALVREAVQRGMLLVAPVGTSDNKKPESRYPARLDGVLSVGAHDQYGLRSSFSARSYDLDLLAPGEGLLATDLQGTPTYNHRSTAVAAAFTAGFLALVRQWQWQQHRQMDPVAVFDLLRRTAIPRRAFNKGDDIEYGHGILNPNQILLALEQP